MVLVRGANWVVSLVDVYFHRLVANSVMVGVGAVVVAPVIAPRSVVPYVLDRYHGKRRRAVRIADLHEVFNKVVETERVIVYVVVLQYNPLLILCQTVPGNSVSCTFTSYELGGAIR